MKFELKTQTNIKSYLNFSNPNTEKLKSAYEIQA